MFSFFLSKNKNIVVFVFLLILSSSFMSFDSSKFSITFKEVGETIIYPFRYLIIAISDGISSLAGSFKDKKELKKKIEDLQNDLIKYKTRMINYEQLLKENQRLKNLLKYKEKEKWEVEIAEIISRDPEDNFSSLTINKGRKDDIKPGMPVFAYMGDEKGIVGVVSESSYFTSKIKTFRNRDFSLGVYLAYSGVHGIIQGVGDNKNIMTLLYIDKDIPINPREFVGTSSEGGIFPPNIYVGTISLIDTTDKTRLTHKVYVKPYIHLSKIKDVFIIKKVPGKNS